MRQNTSVSTATEGACYEKADPFKLFAALHVRYKLYHFNSLQEGLPLANAVLILELATEVLMWGLPKQGPMRRTPASLTLEPHCESQFERASL